MRSLHRLLARASHLTSAHRQNARLHEEIAAHLAAQTEENLRAGMIASEARRQARLKFGAVEAVREHYHAEAGLPFFETLARELRYAGRMLWKSPAFTAVALRTLMLGIGANLGVVGVLNAVLLHPLDVRDPQSLYQLRHGPWSSGRLLTTSYPAFEDLRQRNTTFSGLAGLYAYAHGALSWRNIVTTVSGDEVTGNYFDLLGVQPALGRFFHAADEHGPDSAPLLVLSDALWRSAFAADPAVVGATVELNKHSFTVVGVASPEFHGTERFVWPDFWVPMLNQRQVDGSDSLHDRTAITVTVLGRLKPGVTASQATDNLNTIAAELAHEYPQTDDGVALRLVHPGLYGDDGDVIRGFLLSVTALALLVLAAACANLASLFAARIADRTRELALRVALGSSRRRLVGQLLTEALLVSFLGGAAGLLGASLLLAGFQRWHSSTAYGQLELRLDIHVYLAALALTVSSALLCGLVPARQALRSSPLQIMKGAPAQALSLGRFALRDLLLGAQIAICTLLVTSSLVAVRGMQRALHVPLGFQPQGAMLVDLDLSQEEPPPDLLLQRQHAVLEAVQSLPGVSAAGIISRTPMTGGLHAVPIYTPGTTEFKLPHAALAAYIFSMSPGYLDAARTRLLSGRDLSWHDTGPTPPVAIINQTFAQKMWGQAPAVGQRFLLWGKLTEVVGIAEDGKYHDLQESPQPVAYLPLALRATSTVTLPVRPPRAVHELSPALQRALHSLEPNLPFTVQSWPDALSGELLPARAAAVALGVMGLLACMLAITGIFGMAVYTVSRRLQEFGIRIALGARKSQVLRAAVGRPLALLGLGSGLGLLAGLSASGLLTRIVYQANPRDPLVLAGTLLTMTLLGLAASALPARKALAADPSELLRQN